MNICIGEKCDVEHITPTSGKNLAEIRRDADFDNVEDFEATVNKLGNKILLESKINRSVGNAWFRTKITNKLNDKTGYIGSEYPMAQKLVDKYRSEDKPHWTGKDINHATEEAAERIANFIFGD